MGGPVSFPLWRPLLAVSAILFGAELLIMELLDRLLLPPAPWIEALLDATFLTLTASFLSHILIFQRIGRTLGGGQGAALEIIAFKLGAAVFVTECGIMLLFPALVPTWMEAWRNALDALFLALIAGPMATLWILSGWRRNPLAYEGRIATRTVLPLFFAFFLPVVGLVGLISGGAWVAENSKLRASLDTFAFHHLKLMEGLLRREMLSLAFDPLIIASRLRAESLDPGDWLSRMNREFDFTQSLIQLLRGRPAYARILLHDHDCATLREIGRFRGAVFAGRPDAGEPPLPHCSEGKKGGERIWISQRRNVISPNEPLIVVTIRLANRLDEQLGFLTIETRASAFMERLEKTLQAEEGQFHLVGPSGEWIYGESGVSDDDYARRHATVWQAVFERGRGKFEDASGLHFFIPFTTEGEEAGILPGGTMGGEGTFHLPAWQLILSFPPGWESASLAGFKNTLILLFLVLAPMTGIGCWLLAKSWTRRRLAEEELARHAADLQTEREKLTTIILGAKEGIVVTNPEGCVVLVNPAAERLLGKSAEEIRENGFLALLDDPSYLQSLIQNAGQDMPEVVVYNSRVLNVHAVTIITNDGRRTGSAALLRDVTEEKRLEDRLRQLSNTDGLTGLVNRRRLDQILAEEFRRAKRYGLPIGVLMFDVDHFKRFNDQHGHAVGDKVLQAVSAVARRTFRDVDVVGRYGGEEFMAILPSTSYPGAMIAAERLRKSVAECLVDGLSVTVSVGVAIYPLVVANTPGELVKAADDVLYLAKREGRNRVCVAAGGLDGEEAGRM